MGNRVSLEENLIELRIVSKQVRAYTRRIPTTTLTEKFSTTRRMLWILSSVCLQTKPCLHLFEATKQLIPFLLISFTVLLFPPILLRSDDAVVEKMRKEWKGSLEKIEKGACMLHIDQASVGCITPWFVLRTNHLMMRTWKSHSFILLSVLFPRLVWSVVRLSVSKCYNQPTQQY